MWRPTYRTTAPNPWTIADNGTIYVTLEDTVVAVDVYTTNKQTSFALSQSDSGARTMLMATLAATNSAPTRGSIDEHTESGDGGDHRDCQWC